MLCKIYLIRPTRNITVPSGRILHLIFVFNKDRIGIPIKGNLPDVPDGDILQDRIHLRNLIYHLFQVPVCLQQRGTKIVIHLQDALCHNIPKVILCFLLMPGHISLALSDHIREGLHCLDGIIDQFLTDRLLTGLGYSHFSLHGITHQPESLFGDRGINELRIFQLHTLMRIHERLSLFGIPHAPAGFDIVFSLFCMIQFQKLGRVQSGEMTDAANRPDHRLFCFTRILPGLF